MPRVSAHVAGWDLSLRLGCSGIRTLLIPSQICQSSVSLLEWCFWPSLVSFRQVALTSATRPHNFKTITSRCPRGGSLAIPRRRGSQIALNAVRCRCSVVTLSPRQFRQLHTRCLHVTTGVFLLHLPQVTTIGRNTQCNRIPLSRLQVSDSNTEPALAHQEILSKNSSFFNMASLHPSSIVNDIAPTGILHKDNLRYILTHYGTNSTT